jgi:P27 family predicted phage terminase small subunit
MGKRGPKPKLARLQRLEGNPSKRPIDDFGIAATGEALVPDHLHDDAQACIELIKRSMPPKTYATVDTYALSSFATAWAWHKRATHEMNAPDFDPVVDGSKGQKQPNPWFRILKAMSEEMRSWGDRLGLDPKARAALKLPDEKPRSKFDGLIGQSGSSRSLNA